MWVIVKQHAFYIQTDNAASILLNTFSKSKCNTVAALLDKMLVLSYCMNQVHPHISLISMECQWGGQ